MLNKTDFNISDAKGLESDMIEAHDKDIKNLIKIINSQEKEIAILKMKVDWLMHKI